ncbi:MAG TPA: hypothetical protein VFW73_10575 [Lacipirellulaceae bacterium]|nr:hypothetical protein [Lacipirellulaceae bacterium]
MHTEILITAICLLAQLTQAPSLKNTASDNVEVRYARAQLQLAEANLNRVEQSNKRVAGSVPSSIVAEYQHDLEVAKTRLERVATDRSANVFHVWLQRAEAEQKASETSWKNATTVNGRAPGTFGPLDIERFRLRAEVAKLQLERGRSLVRAGRDDQMQWEIEMLENQVQRLKEESRQSPPFVGYYPFWSW